VFDPVDASAGGIRALGYTKLAKLVGADPEIDAVIGAASGRTIATLGKEADALKTLRADVGKPVIFWSYTTPSADFLHLLSEADLPVAVSPHAVALALAAWATPDEPTPAPYPPVAITGTQTEAEAYPVFEAEGLSAGDWHLCQGPEEAAAKVAEMGGPVALKVQSRDILHKTEAGGVALNVTAEDAAEKANALLAAAQSYAPEAHIDGILVQSMAPPGTEMIIGGFRDPSFGPVVMVGLGGIFTEVLGDVAFAAAPIGEDQAAQLVQHLRGAAMLDGVRGGRPSDRAALAQAVAAVSRLIAAPGVAEIDLNPVFVHETGLTLADALIVAAPDAADATGPAAGRRQGLCP